MMIYFDGGCRPNPGDMEIGVVVDGKFFHETDLGHGTNNEAEWVSLIWALGLAERHGGRDLVIQGDSMLVINQAQGLWKCNHDRLRTYLSEYQKLRPSFNSIKLQHVRRKLNLAGIEIEKSQKSR